MNERSSAGDQPLGSRFWTLWSAFTASNLGDGISVAAFPLLAISLTNDARLIALVAAARFLPIWFFSLPAGVLIDRFDRRLIAIVAQALRAFALIGIGLAVFADSTSIPLLIGAAMLAGTSEVIIDGGLPAIVRNVVKVDQLEVANSRLRASQTAADRFVGPPLGALLFQISNGGAFLVAGGIYLATIVVLAALRGSFVPEKSDDDDKSFITKMRSGVAYVWGHEILRPLALCVAAFSFAGAAHNGMFVVLVTDHFGLSEAYFGFLLAAGSVTSVIMSFFVAKLVQRTSHSWSMRVSVVAFSLHALLMGVFVAVPIVIAAALIAGLSDPTWNVITATVRQRLVEDQIFGRMMTAYLFIAWSVRPIGTLAGGVIADLFGVRWVPIMAAVVIGSLLVFGRPMFRRIDAAMVVASGH